MSQLTPSRWRAAASFVSNLWGALRRFALGGGGSSAQQMTRGGLWVFASHALEQGLSIVRSVILARLLMPSDFGLIGLAAIFTAALQILTETGVWPALIQRKEVDQDVLSTAWIMMAARGLILGLIVVALAPLAAWFFQTPLLIPVLRVTALTFALGGLNSLSLVLLQKFLNFRLLTYIQLTTTCVQFVVAVALAFLLRNFWALVIAELAGAICALALSYLVHDFRPRLRFSWSRARELVNFGRYLTLSGMVTYLATQGDDAYVGKFLGAEALGFYGMAYRASNLPATSISHVINRVTLPGFSAVQDDLAYLRRLYLQTLRMTALLIIPFAGGMFALASYLIPVLYGERWLPVIPSFQMLCFFGLERAIGSVAGPVFLALGKPKWVLQLGLAKLAAMALCIVPLTARYGILGTSIAVTISAVVIQSLVVPAVCRLLAMSPLRMLDQVSKPLLATLLMAVVLLALPRILVIPVNLLSLLGLALFGFLIYAAIVLPGEAELLRKLRSSVLTEIAPGEVIS
jgi:O-antigen/teichoic acid export membrane protein